MSDQPRIRIDYRTPLGRCSLDVAGPVFAFRNEDQGRALQASPGGVIRIEDAGVEHEVLLPRDVRARLAEYLLRTLEEDAMTPIEFASARLTIGELDVAILHLAVDGDVRTARLTVEIPKQALASIDEATVCYNELSIAADGMNPRIEGSERFRRPGRVLAYRVEPAGPATSRLNFDIGLLPGPTVLAAVPR